MCVSCVCVCKFDAAHCSHYPPAQPNAMYLFVDDPLVSTRSSRSESTPAPNSQFNTFTRRASQMVRGERGGEETKMQTYRETH